MRIFLHKIVQNFKMNRETESKIKKKKNLTPSYSYYCVGGVLDWSWRALYARSNLVTALDKPLDLTTK